MGRIRTALQAMAAAHRRGDNTPQPIWPLRDGFDHLTARDSMVVLKPVVGLRFELAAIAKQVDG